MPFIDLVDSPLAPGVSPVRIHYRDTGSGPPIVFLHSGALAHPDRVSAVIVEATHLCFLASVASSPQPDAARSAHS